MRETHFSERLSAAERSAGLTDSEILTLDRGEIYKRIRTLIGQPHAVHEIKLSDEDGKDQGNRIQIVEETANPTGSHYDRCYVDLLERLEREGTIDPGDTLLETSSGSAGISFAWMCKKLGFNSHVFMPAYVPEARIVEVQRLAAGIHLNPDREHYLTASIEDMKAYLRENRATVKSSGHRIWIVNHSQDPQTPRSFAAMADQAKAEMEYWGDRESKVDYFIGGVGNGTSLLGVGARAKELWPDVRVIAFEPTRACPYYMKHRERWGTLAPRFAEDSQIPPSWTFHNTPGIGSFGDIEFPAMERAIEEGIIDDICHVPDSEMLEVGVPNPKLHFLYGEGHSSRLARLIARRMAEGTTNTTFLTIRYDHSDMYGRPKYSDEQGMI